MLLPLLVFLSLSHLLLALSNSPVKSHYPIPQPFHPDNSMERARRQGYQSEWHQTETEDGYVISLFRLPRGKDSGHLLTPNPKPLILQHGILCSSDIWVFTDYSLGFYLANAGYDVWIPNSRGNTYSRGHKKYTIDDQEFWNYSFHEIGYYDLPAAIDYVLAMTGKEEVTYVGHSQGTAVFWVMATTRPEYQRKIKVMSALAPVAFLDHSKGVIQMLAKTSTWLTEAAHLFGVHHVLDRSTSVAVADHIFCNLLPDECRKLIEFIVGKDSRHIDKYLVTYMADIAPTGASIKQLVHFKQLIKNGNFAWYDYGRKENQIIYSNSNPPEYDLGKICIPILIYYGSNDIIASPRDVERIRKKLVNSTSTLVATYNHLDFMWASDAAQVVYGHMVNQLNKY